MAKGDYGKIFGKIPDKFTQDEIDEATKNFEAMAKEAQRIASEKYTKQMEENERKFQAAKSRAR